MGGWAGAVLAALWTSSCLLPGIEANGTSTGGAGGQAVGGTGDVGVGGDPSGGGGGDAGGGSGRCSDSDDCEVQPCFAAACAEGRCVYEPTPGVLAPTQTTGDCVEVVCDARGGWMAQPDDEDVPTDPAPACKAWQCSGGNLSTPDGPDCLNCCGVSDELDCSAGVCEGCGDANDCGFDSTCIHHDCVGGDCITEPINNGQPCASPICQPTAPSTATQHTFACDQGVCEQLISLCGNYLCDANTSLCHDSCAGAPQVCQPGSTCDSSQLCLDCLTCAEVPNSGTKDICPTAQTLLTALQSCYCIGDRNLCGVECSTLCTEGTASNACLTCIQSGPCGAQASACLADVDPVP